MSIRKRVLWLVCLLLVGTFLVATTPQKREIKEFTPKTEKTRLTVPSQLNYQGYLSNASDTSAYEGIVDMTFRIFDAPTGGIVWWAEVHSNVPVVRGLFSVNLGENTAIPMGVFDGSIRYLEIVVEGEVLSPRKKLVSVGYGYRSQIADTALYSVFVDSVATPLILSDSLYGSVLDVENTWGVPSQCQGISVSSDGIGVSVSHSTWAGVYVGNTESHAFSASYPDKCGLYVYDAGEDGVNVVHADDNGIYVGSAGKNGIHINSADSAGIRIEKAFQGVYVDSVVWGYGSGFRVRKAWEGFRVDNASYAGVYVDNAGYFGVYVDWAGDDGVYVNWADDDGVHVGNAGGDGVYVVNAGENGVNVENAGYTGVRAFGKYYGGVFANDSTGSLYPTLLVKNSYGFTANERIASFYAGGYLKFYFQGDGHAYAKGSWGTFKKNRKGEYESFSTIESPNKELIAHGKGRLSNGETYINFDESFSEFVSSKIPVEVTVTPVGSYSGLYIARKDKDGFLVKSGAGDPDCELTWIAIGREKGCEQRAEVGNIEEEERMTRMMEEERERKRKEDREALKVREIKR
jgi:hypothetical protein